MRQQISSTESVKGIVNAVRSIQCTDVRGASDIAIKEFIRSINYRYIAKVLITNIKYTRSMLINYKCKQKKENSPRHGKKSEWEKPNHLVEKRTSKT